jgi:glycosyltransferase involved in cell wall biosynthesis
MLAACDHYLSYTEASTANILHGGYDKARLTTLNNAVEPLATPGQLIAAQRTPLQLLFVASLVADKEPLTAVRLVDKLQGLGLGATLRIVGDGPLRNQCEQAASSRSWVHYHGAQHGQGLRELALTSDIALIPGRVGLAILEMASAGLPVATLSTALHGTEIVYLKDGINGIFLDSDIDVAARALQALLTCRPALERMRSAALGTAGRYTVRNMAVNFANGVANTLERPLPQRHCA